MKAPVPEGQLKPHWSTQVSSNLGPISCPSIARPGGLGPFARAQMATKVPNDDARSRREGSVMFNHNF